jgi:hypothetical protein
VGDVASAKSLYGLLTPWAAFNAVDVAEGFRGAISRYLGLLATMLELFDAAERHFEDALALNTQMGALPWVARTQIDCARMLLARERAGDRERARLLGDAGLATCVELGMQASTVSPP